jgi:hypothetical protein
MFYFCALAFVKNNGIVPVQLHAQMQFDIPLPTELQSIVQRSQDDSC